MIDYFDYRPGYAQHRDELEAAIRRVLASGRLILGPEVRAFEEEFASYVGARYAVGVASGTDALILALRSLRIGVGDEVITVANAGVPTVAAIRAAGATPRFAEVDPQTLLMDPDALEGAMSQRTRGIVPVHLYGHPAPLGRILDFARSHDLHVIEDSAQAHGARHEGAHVGSLGVIGCFSFYPTKNLGAFGDGGMCVTSDPKLVETLRAQRMYGYSEGDRRARIEGLNSRLDELQAAILRVRLRHLDAALDARRALARRYLATLDSDAYGHPSRVAATDHAYHIFAVTTPDRDAVCAALEADGIGYGIHYADPVHQMEAYGFLGYRAGELPISESACRRVLSLPLYPGLAEESVDRVLEVLQRAASTSSVDCGAAR